LRNDFLQDNAKVFFLVQLVETGKESNVDMLCQLLQIDVFENRRVGNEGRDD